MSQVPAVSVIIPMYNTKKYIQQAIDSALNQTFHDIEVIIVDDCSTDGSYELCQKLYGGNKQVKLFHNEKNQGSALTRNNGIREASGKYITFLDSDDVYFPYAIEKFYNTAEKEQAEIVSADVYTISNGEEIPKDYSNISKVVVDGLCVDKPFLIPPPL